MTIYLVRHAQPLVEGGICYGASDVACDPLVVQTAAAQLLRELPQGLPIIRYKDVSISRSIYAAYSPLLLIKRMLRWLK
jgi:broad specificity phosphatase PhoE